MKLVVIVVVLLVLVAGGGGAVYFFKESLFGAEGAADVAAKAPIQTVPDALFVDLETLNIAVIHNRRVEKHVLLQVTLEVGNEETRTKVAKALPRIKDAFIRDLYDYYAVQTPGRRGINVEAIKRRLKRTADEVVGGDAVTKVLIQGAVERETGPN